MKRNKREETEIVSSYELIRGYDYCELRVAGSELLMEQYGYRLHAFALRRGGAVVSAVPFLETRSLTGGRKMILNLISTSFSIQK